MGAGESKITSDGSNESIISSPKVSSECSFFLPKEICYEILLFLPLKDIATFSIVSKENSNLLFGDVIWKLLLKRDHRINFSKDESVTPYELYKQCSSTSGFFLPYFRSNRKEKENPFEEVQSSFVRNLWSNCICCDGNIVVFGFEMYSTYFFAYDCRTGERIGSGIGGSSRCVAIHQGILYVGTDRNIRLYQINENFKFLKTFGGNTAKFPPCGGIISAAESQERKRLRNGHGGSITHIVFTKDYIISGCSGGYCYIWKKDTHECVILLHDGGFVQGLDCQGDYVALASGNGVHLFDLTDFSNFAKLTNESTAFAFCGDIFFYTEKRERHIFKIVKKKGWKAELVLKGMKKVDEYIGRRIITDSNSMVSGSGSVMMIFVDGKKIKMFDVTSKAFQEGDFEESELFSQEVDISKYKETKFCAINGAAFARKNLYVGIGRFNFSWWKIKEL